MEKFLMAARIGARWAGQIFLSALFGLCGNLLQTGSLHATPIYGVGLYESATAASGKSFNSGGSCGLPCPYNGNSSVSNALSNSASTPPGPSSYPYPATSTSTSVSATANLGNLHVNDFSSGSQSSDSSANAVWADVLTIGNNFSPSTPLKFEVSLDLTGMISGSSDIFTGVKSSSVEEAVSTLILNFNSAPVNTIYPNNVINFQDICSSSQGGVIKACNSETEMTTKAFSTVLTLYPGESLSVYDSLKSNSSVVAGYTSYQCGSSTCFKVLAASSTVDFSNTSLFTFIPLTPGAFYTSASGTIYSGAPGGGLSSTPEPSSLVLMVTGLAGILGWSLFRQRNRGWAGL